MRPPAPLFVGVLVAVAAAPGFALPPLYVDSPRVHDVLPPPPGWHGERLRHEPLRLKATVPTPDRRAPEEWMPGYGRRVGPPLLADLEPGAPPLHEARRGHALAVAELFDVFLRQRGEGGRELLPDDPSPTNGFRNFVDVLNGRERHVYSRMKFLSERGNVLAAGYLWLSQSHQIPRTRDRAWVYRWQGERRNDAWSRPESRPIRTDDLAPDAPLFPRVLAPASGPLYFSPEVVGHATDVRAFRRARAYLTRFEALLAEAPREHDGAIRRDRLRRMGLEGLLAWAALETRRATE